MNQNIQRNMYTARCHFFSDQLKETDEHISYMMQGLLKPTVLKQYLFNLVLFIKF